MTRLLLIVISGALAVMTAACSGGSVSVGASIPSLPLVPATEPVTASGVITALDSAGVTGVRFDTSGATVVVNGETASPSDLRSGQRVTLQGEIDVPGITGAADSIAYDADIIGPVESIEPDSGRLVVMGQRVLVDQRTEFGPDVDPDTFAGIAIDDALHVSGLARANGDVAATRIELDPDATGVQVVGKVTALDFSNMLFAINDLLVDYGNAGLIDIPAGMPMNQMRLVVRGDLVDGILVAAELRSAESVPRTAFRRVRIQGYVSEFNAVSDFAIGGRPVRTDFDTDYVGGSASDIRVDVEITVVGRVAGDGLAILADQIRFGGQPRSTTTLTYDFRDFNALSVSSVFDVTVTQAPDFAVDVTIDADAVDSLVVARSGNTLQLGLRTGNVDVRTIKARVSLPTLTRIDLNGVVRASVDGFDQAALDVAMSGVSQLRGHSSIFTHLTAGVSGVSSLNLGDVRPMSTADIDVAGVSKATVNMAVGSSITGSVFGPSVLRYYGTNVDVDVFTDLTSSVVKLGETRP